MNEQATTQETPTTFIDRSSIIKRRYREGEVTTSLSRTFKIKAIDPKALLITKGSGFLPAFKGAKPYHQAYSKGVKIIGAPAHYVTDRLDEGPIIAQDIVHVNHKHSIKDMIQLGREIERNVLYKAVKSHLEYKIIVHDNKTIIFD